MKVDLDAFNKLGYAVIDVAPLMPKITRLRAEIFDLFDTIARGVGTGPIRHDEDLVAFYRARQKVQYEGLKHGSHTFSLHAIAGDLTLEKFLKEELKFQCPNHDSLPNLRVDMPVENQSIFAQHQDYAFNRGSQNSVTLWIPLQNTGIEEGAPLISPGSHKDGLYPYDKRNGTISSSHKFSLIPCEVGFGQALLFDQKLVHQSGFNRSSRIRISVQLRVSDMACADYAARGYKINHQSVVSL